MTTWLLRLGEHDRKVLHALVLRRRTGIDPVMRALTHLGDAGVVIGLTLLLGFGLVPGLAGPARTAAVALATSHALVQLLKRTVGRPRPHLPVGIESLVDAPDRFSFPSGHAAASLSVALPLAAALPLPWAAIVVGLAAVVGVSRCYLGVHYPGDGLAGWTLAVLGVLSAPLSSTSSEPNRYLSLSRPTPPHHTPRRSYR